MKPLVLRFPLEYSIGTLSVRSFGGDGEWVELSDARGEVTKTEGQELKLSIDTRVDFDANLMLSFPPDAFSVLVWVSSSKITNTSMSYIRHLAGLKGLALWESQIGDEGLVSIRGFRNLLWLDIGDTRVSDDGLLELNDLGLLESLTLLNDRITDAGIVHLQRLPSLRSLDLMNTLITDACVEVIRKMPLKDLRITNTLITKEGYRRLSAALPNCRIEHEYPGGTMQGLMAGVKWL